MVAAWSGAAWFTASTSFANPAITIARSLSNTFSGIRPAGPTTVERDLSLLTISRPALFLTRKAGALRITRALARAPVVNRCA